MGVLRERLVLAIAKHSQIVCVLTPGQTPIDRRGQLEHVKRSGGRIIKVHTVAGTSLRFDRHRQQCSDLGPRESRHVAEVGDRTACEIADQQIGHAPLASLWLIRSHSEVLATLAENERSDVVYYRLITGSQV